jgi:hypothetical protein
VIMTNYIFWEIMPYSAGRRIPTFRRKQLDLTHKPKMQTSRVRHLLACCLFIRRVDSESTFFRNVRTCLSDYTTTYPRRQYLLASLFLKQKSEYLCV